MIKLSRMESYESGDEIEDKLKRNGKLFRTLIEKNADMMTLALPEGKVIYVSPSITNVLGFSSEDYKTRPAFEFIHPDDIPGLLEQLQGIIDTPGKSFFRQQRLLHKDGSYRWCEGTITNMLHDPDIGALVSNFRDITERKKAEEALLSAEANYREIFEMASDAIYVHEITTGKVLDVNLRATEITGYTKEEIIDGDPRQFITDNPDYSFQKAIEYIQKAAAGAPQLFEWLGKRKDGSNTWFEVNLKIATIAGKDRILAFFRGIDERKRNEENIRTLNEKLERKVMERTAQLEINIQQLKESEEKFLKAFQASAAGISITRLSDSTYLEVNDAFAKMTGYSKAELIGHTSAELGFVADIKKREEVLQLIRETGSAKNFELQVYHKSGKALDVLSSVETIVLKGEKFAINIIYDITDRKRKEEELEALNKELESFSYSISHDLRTPLRALNGYAEMLNEEYYFKLDEEGRRIIRAIKYNSARMGSLIDNLLAFSRLGRKEIQKSRIDMNVLANAVINEIKQSARHRAQIKIGKLHQLIADYRLLHQVMFNLISNAIKYSSKKENPVVEIFSEEQDGHIIYSVRDNGAGFDMQYADKLFGVFQRLHSQEEFDGIGVGLAIVQRVITKHGGKVWAEGKTNEGAIFYFSLLKEELS